MDEKFQDRIDNYLLNRMDDAEKTEFLHEIKQDKEKKEQLEFTQDVKDCIRSREEKLKALNSSNDSMNKNEKLLLIVLQVLNKQHVIVLLQRLQQQSQCGQRRRYGCGFLVWQLSLL